VLEELQKQYGDADPPPPLAEAGRSGTGAPSAAAPGPAAESDAIQQAMADLENINAHLFSIEALMERIFDVRVPEDVEQKFREVAGELAPDPLNADRLRLNRLLHQTPDLPDRS
jgi:hypothetical protein